MTAETIRDLLEPLVGKSGSIFIVVNRIGPIGFATTEHKKLTSVEIRPDGHFLTYGIGVPLLRMRDPSASRARTPV